MKCTATKRACKHQHRHMTGVRLLAYTTIAFVLYVAGSVAAPYIPTPQILSTTRSAEAFEIVSPLPTTEARQATPSARLIPSEARQRAPEGTDSQQEKIEAYITTIFGSEARTAIAVSHYECNPANAKYPKCRLFTAHEDSIGLFQINLYNSRQWIHAGRIPGETMDEKRAWLEDPYNNTLYAYWIWTTSGWNPWSAYTSGNYLNDFK